MRYSEIITEKKKKRRRKRANKAVLPRYYGYWGITGFQSAGVESSEGGDISEAEEYDGQNKFVQNLQKNPRIVARHVAAIKKFRNAYIKACSEVGFEKIHGASLSILGNYPHSDSSVEAIEGRIGKPDWDDCDHVPKIAYDYAIKILDDAINHPIDWDCVSGMAMKYILGRYDPFYS